LAAPGAGKFAAFSGAEHYAGSSQQNAGLGRGAYADALTDAVCHTHTNQHSYEHTDSHPHAYAKPDSYPYFDQNSDADAYGVPYSDANAPSGYTYVAADQYADTATHHPTAHPPGA